MYSRFWKYSIIVLTALLMACSSGENQEKSDKESEGSQEKSGSADAKPAQTSGSQDSIILFFGNSLTAGYQLEMSEAFPALIQEKIDSLSLPYEVRNSGVSGETSTGGKNRIDFVLSTLDKALSVFVLELGANDGLRGIDLDESEKNLQDIIDKVKSHSPEVKLIVCGMEVPPNMGETYVVRFRNMFPELAESNEAGLVPFLLDGVAAIPELNLPDGIHPTPEGHKILANNVWDILSPMIIAQESLN